MTAFSLEHIIPIIQVAVGPVVMISGVGLLVLAFSNQMGRVIDRTRELYEKYFHVENHEEKDKQSAIKHQIDILWKRAKFVRSSLLFAGICIFFVILLIISMFLIRLISSSNGIILFIFFLLSLLSLVISVLFFMLNVQLSLKALKLEIKGIISID